MSTPCRTAATLLAALCAAALSSGGQALCAVETDTPDRPAAGESRDIREIAGTYWSQGPFVGPEPRDGWSDDGVNDEIPIVPRVRREASWPTHGTRYEADVEGIRWSYDHHEGWLPELEDPGEDVITENEAIFGGDSMSHSGFWE